VVAPTEGARRFVERFRGSLFPDLPVVFIDRVTSARPEPGMTGISAALDLTGTLSLARSLQPGITQVFVVSGVSPFDQFYERLAREQFQQVGSLTTTYLSGLSLADLEQ